MREDAHDRDTQVAETVEKAGEYIAKAAAHSARVEEFLQQSRKELNAWRDKARTSPERRTRT